MSDQYDIDSVDNRRRRDLGLQVLSRIDGDAGQSVIESLSASNRLFAFEGVGVFGGVRRVVAG